MTLPSTAPAFALHTYKAYKAHNRALASLVLAWWFVGCTPMTSLPPEEGTVTHSGIELDKRIVSTRTFQQVVFMKRAAPPVSRPETWVFIDGDGNAWMHDGRAAEDPTPTDAVALELLALTPSPAIYLARACTFGTAAVDALCEPAVWTIDRYGESAVASMADALDVLGLSSSPLVIVGYSGGGVIATALANRLRNTVGLLTIAANLDVPRWVEYHGYAAELARRSLPAQLPLAAHIVQLHVYGLDDRNVPYELAANEIARDPNATTVVLSGADHDCCWSDLWPQIRQQFQQLMDASELTRATSSSR